MQEHKAILGHCNHEYIWDDVTSAMQIQLDMVGRDDRGHGRYGAYPADYDDEEEALLNDECGMCDDEDIFISEEDYDALAAAIDELEGVIDEVDPDEISQEECVTLATEAQRLGWKAGRRGHKPNYKQAREKLAQSKFEPRLEGQLQQAGIHQDE